jgi:hypothetical protein
MHKFHVYQAIWAMESLDNVDLENNIDGALDMIQAAGFDGVGTSLLRKERSEAVSRGARERKMPWEASAFIRTADELAKSVDRAQELGAHHLNVQIMERLDRVSDAVALLEAYGRVTEKANISVFYETHRARLTNDLLFTLRILDELPDLKLTGDLSHYPVVHEFPLPMADVDLKRMSRIIANCWAFHGRVSGSHQIQVSLQFPQHQQWVSQFKSWWKEGMTSWLSRAPQGSELTFMCELGPPNYAITNAEGRELVDRWQEALIMKEMIRGIWADVTAKP